MLSITLYEAIFYTFNTYGEEGRKEKEIQVAKNLLKVGVSVDIIAETTGLPIDEVKDLMKLKA